jgi:hypothetical protein
MNRSGGFVEQSKKEEDKEGMKPHNFTRIRL